MQYEKAFSQLATKSWQSGANTTHTLASQRSVFSTSSGDNHALEQGQPKDKVRVSSVWSVPRMCQCESFLAWSEQLL